MDRLALIQGWIVSVARQVGNVAAPGAGRHPDCVRLAARLSRPAGTPS